MKKFLFILFCSLLTIGCYTFASASDIVLVNDEIQFAPNFAGNDQEDALNNYFKILSKIPDDLYGGSYINEADELVVLILPEKEYIKSDIKEINGIVFENIVFENAEYSMAELVTVRDFIFNHSEELKIPGVSIDVIDNKVKIILDIEGDQVDLDNIDELEASIERFSIERLGDIPIEGIFKVTYQELPKLINEANLESIVDFNEIKQMNEIKDVVEINDIAPKAYTVQEPYNNATYIHNNDGFASIAWGTNGARYLVSIGHEFKVGESIYQGSTKIGTVERVKFNGSADSCKIALDSGASYKYRYSSAVQTSGSSLPIGTSIYQNGVGGLRSGEIISNQATYTGFGYTWRKLYQANTTTYHGDSGGSMMIKKRFILYNIRSYT